MPESVASYNDKIEGGGSSRGVEDQPPNSTYEYVDLDSVPRSVASSDDGTRRDKSIRDDGTVASARTASTKLTSNSGTDHSGSEDEDDDDGEGEGAGVNGRAPDAEINAHYSLAIRPEDRDLGISYIYTDGDSMRNRLLAAHKKVLEMPAEALTSDHQPAITDPKRDPTMVETVWYKTIKAAIDSQPPRSDTFCHAFGLDKNHYPGCPDMVAFVDDAKAGMWLIMKLDWDLYDRLLALEADDRHDEQPVESSVF